MELTNVGPSFNSVLLFDLRYRPGSMLLLFNIGIEIGQDVFVFLVLALKRSFRQLEIHWPQWAVRLPGYAVGVAGAFWTFEHTTALFLPGG